MVTQLRHIRSLHETFSSAVLWKRNFGGLLRALSNFSGIVKPSVNSGKLLKVHQLLAVESDGRTEVDDSP